MFKTLTMASALENHIAKSNTKFYCENGHFRIGDHVIGEAEEKKVFKWLTMEDILKYSSNIGTTKIAFELQYPRLKKTLADFNIGQKTGVEIPGESRGILEQKDKIIPIRLSNISFGQGVATTGIQMLAAYSSIANGGKWVQPTILLQDSNDERILSQFPRKNSERIISQQTATDLTKMLMKVVEEGTGTNARVAYFNIAGKTSTAQRVSAKGGYDGYISSFVGFPVNAQNKFVVLVYIDHPSKKEYYGNTVAAPAFRKITEYLLYKENNYQKLAISGQKRNLANDQLHIIQSSSQVVEKGRVPYFIGMDKKLTDRLAEDYKISIRHHGFGFVVQQSVAAGSEIKNNMVIDLQYEWPNYE